MIEVPEGSIYLWMYSMGLQGYALEDVERAVFDAGKDIRKKDYLNFDNGRRNRTSIAGKTLLRPLPPKSEKLFLTKEWHEYEQHPYARLPEIDCRWIPIGYDGKPMVKWTKHPMYKEQAEAWPGCKSLAENLHMTQMIVVDCDGDHGSELDMKVIDFLWKYHGVSHALDKRKMIAEYDDGDPMDFRPASFHLTFKVDKLVPTMHFPKAHMDIIGNAGNSLRYRKDKVWNGIDPVEMDDVIWTEMVDYIRYRYGE